MPFPSVIVTRMPTQPTLSSLTQGFSTRSCRTLLQFSVGDTDGVPLILGRSEICFDGRRLVVAVGLSDGIDDTLGVSEGVRDGLLDKLGALDG